MYTGHFSRNSLSYLYIHIFTETSRKERFNFFCFVLWLWTFCYYFYYTSQSTQFITTCDHYIISLASDPETPFYNSPSTPNSIQTSLLILNI